MTQAAIAVFVVALLVLGLALLRTRTAGKYEIKTSDIALALVPVALWMLFTGKVQELTVGDVKIVTAFRDAAQSPINKQVTQFTPLPVTNVLEGAKADVGQIPRLLQKNTEALSFRLGGGHYYGPAIAEYMSKLSQSPSFRYVVVLQSDGKFVGIMEARQLLALLTTPGQQMSDQIATYLNDNDLAAIQKLPGLILASKAVRQTADKRQVLTQMQEMDVQTLPVVDDVGAFVGVVDRSKLTASILIEIAQKVGT
jgi:CBS domain-containing protein